MIRTTKRTPTTALFIVFVTMLFMALASPALAADAPEVEVAKLTASDGATGDISGWSVSVSGDTAIVGSPHKDDDSRTWAGAAYVYVRTDTSWTQQAKLTPADVTDRKAFGESVAISGDAVVIGAPGDSDWAGAAYVFTRTGTTWTQQAKLTASDRATGDNFGEAVAMYGDTALIGAQQDQEAGSAYVFTRGGTMWTQEAKLLPSDGAVGDLFGISVSVSADTAAIGAPTDDDIARNAGSAYIFARSGTTWTLQAKLTPSDLGEGDWFGEAVSVSGDTVVIGAASRGETGSAYVFTRTGATWAQQATLSPSDIMAGDHFGFSVALSGDTAVVGALGDDDNGDGSGSAYIFTRTGATWTQQTKLTPTDGAVYDGFGTGVAISGATAVVGAVGDDDHGSESGSAYVFAPAIEPTAGNVLATAQNTIVEYTPDGQEVQQIAVPYPGEDGRGDVRDLAFTDDGRVVVYNGTFEAFISVFDPGSGPWTHHVVRGLSTGGGVSGGGLAVLNQYAFATDESTGGGTENGVVRVDLNSGDFVRFATSLGPTDLDIGGDGLLYVLSPGGGQLDVFDPVTLDPIRVVNIGGYGDIRSVAVNDSGQIFLASWAGTLVRLSPSGAFELEARPNCGRYTFGCSYTDINVAPDGTMLTATRSGDIQILDQDFNIMKLLDSSGTFVGGGSAPTHPRLNISGDVSLERDHIGDVAFTSHDATLNCKGRSITGSGTESIGVWVFGVDRVRLQNCHIAGFEIGVFASRTSDSELLHNTVDRPDTGFVLAGEDGGATRLVLSRNLVNDAASTGYLLGFDTTDVELTDNKSLNAGSIGFHVNGVYNGSLTKNTTTGGVYGFVVDQGAEGIVLSRNTAKDGASAGYRVWFAGLTHLDQNSYEGEAEFGFIVGGSSLDGSSLSRNTAVHADIGYQVSGRNIILDRNTASRCAGGGFSIQLQGGDVSGNEAVRNGGIGFSIRNSTNLSISDNGATKNDSAGFELRSVTYSDLSNNSATRNGGHGFELIGQSRPRGGDNALVDNTATNNDGDGFNGSSFGESHDTYERNTSVGNAGFGFVTGSSAVVRENSAERNDSSGFKIGGAEIVVGNTATGNGQDGFELGSADSGIEGNTANRNHAIGFNLWSLENSFTKNEGCNNHDTDFFYQPSDLSEYASIEGNTFCHSIAFALVISDQSDRSTSVPSMAILPDEAYIFLAPLDPSSTAEEVTFTLDGVVTNVDDAQPWDLIGGTEQHAEPLIALAIDEGEHLVEAVVDFKGKRESLSRTIGIYVEHPLSPPVSPPMSPPMSQVLQSIHAAIVPLMSGPFGIAMTAFLVLALAIFGVKRGAGLLYDEGAESGEHR